MQACLSRGNRLQATAAAPSISTFYAITDSISRTQAMAGEHDIADNSRHDQHSRTSVAWVACCSTQSHPPHTSPPTTIAVIVPSPQLLHRCPLVAIRRR